MEGYTFKLPIQLRYSDFDMLGHMNSAQYATLIELGRLRYFMHIKWDLSEVSNVVASFKIDYLKQIIPADEVVVYVKVSSLGTKSFKMEYLLASPDDKTMFAKAETVQVCILKKGNVSTAIPESIRAAIKSYENL
ncbi:MAG: acyl-CoA thioesterase [Cyclobacteriaceae bacterium]|nr:acyl-CoA thioesterase [Cyclobacteriaceae bacterium]